ncbi:MAG: MBL fold metallo-hydrolase [Ilumatobacteraceae bacterium]|nr:MBL fold metallo-hydrolase [Ilumatobacteraceae bacterium]
MSANAEIEKQVDHLIDTRPGKELLAHIYEDPASEVAPGIFRSSGSTAAYMIVHDTGRIIVNTGMGYEAVHHKRVFDAICIGPTTHIVTTQAHVDHVGGVALFREEGTVYIAQENNSVCQADDARIQKLRYRTAQVWFDVSGAAAQRIASQNPGVAMKQDTPTPDIVFTDRHTLSVGGRTLELIAATGETVDSLIVWLPQSQTALISNLLGPLFPHFPNFNTLRGDRYRFVEPYLETVQKLRSLNIAVLVTGRHTPVIGAELIDASLARLHAAVQYVHLSTLEGMNAGVDVYTLMKEITLPAHQRVGQGYGKVVWAVRTIWETYMGWFHLQSTTELYADRSVEAMSELVQVIGADAVCARAVDLLDAGQAVRAIYLAEAVLHELSDHAGAADLMLRAHETLLTSGGDVSFWESGWLRDQIKKWSAIK